MKEKIEPSRIPKILSEAPFKDKEKGFRFMKQKVMLA